MEYSRRVRCSQASHSKALLGSLSRSTAALYLHLRNLIRRIVHPYLDDALNLDDRSPVALPYIMHRELWSRIAPGNRRVFWPPHVPRSSSCILQALETRMPTYSSVIVVVPPHHQPMIVDTPWLAPKAKRTPAFPVSTTCPDISQ